MPRQPSSVLEVYTTSMKCTREKWQPRVIRSAVTVYSASALPITTRVYFWSLPCKYTATYLREIIPMCRFYYAKTAWQCTLLTSVLQVHFWWLKCKYTKKEQIATLQVHCRLVHRKYTINHYTIRDVIKSGKKVCPRPGLHQNCYLRDGLLVHVYSAICFTLRKGEPKGLPKRTISKKKLIPPKIVNRIWVIP